MIHAGLALMTTLLLVGFIFYIYIPITTNHGESLTVPNLEGMSLEELEEFLEDRDLRFEIEPDSGFSPKYPPLTVLKQFPFHNAKVKENRKIYVTLNANNPPVVRMPNLIGRSLKNAQLELRSLGLSLGERRYKPDFALNTILGQYFSGKKVKEGDQVPKGSKIDFDVADGLGNQTFQIPNLTNLDLEEALFTIKGTGLKLGDVFYSKTGNGKIESENEDGEMVVEEIQVNPGRVYKQSPSYKKMGKIGQTVDIWLVEIDSTSLNSSPSLELITEEN